jgi:2'-5' RNA ligase
MEQIRSFIAIELPDELKTGLVRLQTRLKTGQHSAVKWVDPSSIHLTLKFLGNIAADKISGITEAMETATEKIPPFHLEVRELGVFPSLRRVQVVWVGVSGDLAMLRQLHQRIESNLIPLGFTPESRPFTPHLTLARVREQIPPGEVQSFGQLIASTRFETTYGFKVDAIKLMRSQLTREGAIYSQISPVYLTGACQQI